MIKNPISDSVVLQSKFAKTVYKAVLLVAAIELNCTKVIKNPISDSVVLQSKFAKTVYKAVLLVAAILACSFSKRH